MMYRCIGQCPELDERSIPHCTATVNNEEELFNLKDKECPAGNRPNWVEELEEKR